ncbi:protein 4.1b [Trichomycterus rosablanca]|uniref:protein 4.1b n=1 Tax=Trichomycterus rosablanca TaxID=2290929 RepID=UPI002F3504A6
MLCCRIYLLDDTYIERDLEKNAVGQVLFDNVCEHFNLLERDYFGLAIQDSSNTEVWLDVSKEVRKQVKGHDATFKFIVKFYPPDPSLLAEDITRYLLCLQLRMDIMTGRLPCPSDMLALLGSYTIQSEFGDYDPDMYSRDFLSNIPLAPDQTPELEEKVSELHQMHKSMSPAQADEHFLQIAKTLNLYGMHLHTAKDVSGADVMLGVCANGLEVYEDGENTQSVIWPSILKMSYKRNYFFARMRHVEDASESTIKFILPSYRACKSLWKIAVEHHAFFRNNRKDTSEGLLHLGSRFRFHGLTYAESLEASSNIDRPAPRFSHSAIKRKAKEMMPATLKHQKPMKIDDWFHVLGSDQQWNINPEHFGMDQEEVVDIETDNNSQTDRVTPAYKAWSEDKGKEWFELLDRFSFPPQLSLTSADKLGQDLEWEEGTSKEILENASISDIAGKNLELDIAVHQQIKAIEEMIEEMGNVDRVQGVVVHKQTTKEEIYNGEPLKVLHHQTIRRVEIPNTVNEVVEIQIDSEDNIQELQKRLLEVETIEQKLQNIEGQNLKQVKNKGRQPSETDDWYHLLDYKPLVMSSLSAADKQREELEWEDRRSKEVLKNVNISDTVGKNLELDIAVHQQIKVIEEMIEEMGNVDRVQGVVVHKQTTKEEIYKGEPLEVLHHQTIRRVEIPNTVNEVMIEEVQVVSDENIQGLQKRLLEVETIEQKLQDIKELQFRLHEVEMLEQNLKQVRNKERQPFETDDWYRLLEYRPPAMSSASAGFIMDPTEQKAEIIHWKDESVQRANSITPVQFKEDWYRLLELLPRSKQAMQPSVEKKMDKVIKWKEERESPMKKILQTHLPKKREHPVKETEDDWFTLLDVPAKEIVPSTDIYGYEETREKKAEFVDKQETITYNQTTTKERKEAMMETLSKVDQKSRVVQPGTDNWFVLLDPIPYEKRSLQSDSAVYEDTAGLTVQQRYTVEENVVTTKEKIIIIRKKQVEGGELKKKMTVEPREVDDSWFVLFNQTPFKKRSIAKVPVTAYFEDTAGLRRQERVTIKENLEVIEQRHLKARELEEKIPVVAREVDDSWFVHFDLIPLKERSRNRSIGKVPVIQIHEDTLERIQMKEKEVIIEEKSMNIRKKLVKAELEKKGPVVMREVDDSWYRLFDQTPFGKRRMATGVSDTWILGKSRIKDIKEMQLKEEARKKHQERGRIPPQVPVVRVDKPHRDVDDDWYILLGVQTKKSGLDRIISHERTAWQPRVSVTVTPPVDLPKARPLFPADQPMTSTPTGQLSRITRHSYQEESLRRLEISQYSTQDVTQESKVETESVLIRKRRERKIEGETIYIRHSILMLEDFDVTQEVVLKHHASVSELKRLFMEDIPVFGPTEWEKRLSTHTPVIIPQLSNGELFISIDTMGRETISVM